MKNDVFFHDGRRLEPEDIVGSFQAIKSQGKFTALMLDPISSVKKSGPQKVVISTAVEDPLLLRRISFWFRAYPCRNTCSTKDGMLAGTGPYVLSKRGKNTLHLKGRGAKAIAEVRYLPHDSPVQALSINPRNRIVIADTPRSDLLYVKKRLKLKLATENKNLSIFGVFNLMSSSPVVKDPRIREAINLSLDRPLLNKLVFHNDARELASFSLPSDGGHNPHLTPYKFDVKKAQALISLADGHGKELRIGIQTSDPIAGKFTSFLKKSIEKIGFKVRILDEYKVALHQKFKKEVDIVVGYDPSPYGHFDFNVKDFFSEKSPYFLVRSSLISSLMGKRSTPAEYDLIFQRIDKEIHTKHYVIPGFQPLKHLALSRDLSYAADFSGLFNLSNLRTK